MGTNEHQSGAPETTGNRIVLSYPGTLSAHAHRRIQQDYYRSYLRTAHDEAHVGDEWEEFTDIGCCGSQEKFQLRVEAVTGDNQVTPDTVIKFQERDDGTRSCNWDLQQE